jgi:site-specific recombinase XerD
MFNAVSDFVIFCRVERRLADLTCTAYERDVRAWLDFLRAQGIAALIEIRTPDLRRFLAREATHRPAPSSQSRTVAALRCFFRFCVESDYLERDPAHVLRTPKKREALPDILDRAELSRLLDVPGKQGVWLRVHPGKVQRDRLLLALFAYRRLRRSELLGLDCDDVDLDLRLIRVRNAKGGRQRVVPIHPGLVPLPLAYAATRPAIAEQALFLGVHGARLSPSIMALTFRPLRQQAQEDHPAHAAPRVRDRAAWRGREPAPDPGAARTQAPGLHPALHARQRPPAARRGQATAMGGHAREHERRWLRGARAHWRSVPGCARIGERRVTGSSGGAR